MVPQLATAAAQGNCLLKGIRKDKADRWERPAYLRQSARVSGRSLGCVWEGASTNGLGTVGGLGVRYSYHARRGREGAKSHIYPDCVRQLLGDFWFWYL